MTTSDSLISIIIPTYNYARLLPRALDSVLGQWAADLELIVVDDGSQDDTPTVLAGYQQRYPQIQVLRQVNAGAAAARNAGIRLACGRFALLLDADDALLPDALSQLRALLVRRPDVGLVLGGQVSVYADGRERLRMPTPVPDLPAEQLIQLYLLRKQISISHCCSLFRREYLLERPYPQRLRTGEDIAVFAYLLVRGEVAVLEQPLARIHKHADSLRHLREDEEEIAMVMVEEVFAQLPESCQALRERYRAQRYLSLFRAAHLAGESSLAGRYYRQALRISPGQALRWTYLKKFLRLLVGRT